MKILNEKFPTRLTLDGISTIGYQFEVGDIFIDENDKTIGILRMDFEGILMRDCDGREYIEKDFLSEEWVDKYRYSGLSGDDLYDWENALDLSTPKDL